MIIKSNTGQRISREAINDKRLSIGALAVLTYLMAQPENYNVYAVKIAERFHCDRHTIQKYLDELVKYGYAQKSKAQYNGTKTFYDYNVSDKPMYNIYSGKISTTYNIKNGSLIVNTQVKRCIEYLQMLIGVYQLKPDEPIESIKPQIRYLVKCGIDPKVLRDFAADYLHSHCHKGNSKLNLNKMMDDIFSLLGSTQKDDKIIRKNNM